VIVVALAALGVFAACGVDAIDFTGKTCPCPDALECDNATNRCVPRGSLQPASTPICTPKSCADRGVECGATNDGCDGLLDCGKCTLPNTTCIADTNKCVCQPQNCAMQGAECGEVPSGCGETFKCDACPPALPNCGGAGPNKCGTATCVPKTCVGLGACGTVSDGCGKVLECGGCTSPASCGGGGVANKCGCVAKSCAQVGWQCGTGPDGCGGTRTCSPCPGTFTCENGNHTCKCGTPPVPLTCTTAGWKCGTGSDGCGGTLTCPACSGGAQCEQHRCED
jgi:hypothetical protein